MTNLLPGTRVLVLSNAERFGTIVAGVAPSRDKVLVQLDDFAEMGGVHAMNRADLEVVR